jgi:hypothetical protein
MPVKVGKLEIIGALLIVALFCGDLITTHIILSGGGAELNPFTRPLWEAGILSVLLRETPLYAVLILGTVIISDRIRRISKENVRLSQARYFVWAAVLSMFAFPPIHNLCVILL